MKFLLLIGIMFLSSCAHHSNYKEVTHHHHKGKMNCTICPANIEAFYDKDSKEIAKEDLHKINSKEYELYHNGLHYYFTSEEKLNKFKSEAK